MERRWEQKQPKRAAKRAAYDIKRAAGKERFGGVIWWEDDWVEVFEIVKQVTLPNQRCCWGQMRENWQEICDY